MGDEHHRHLALELVDGGGETPKGRRIHYDFQMQRRNRVEFALFGGGAIQAAGGFVEDQYLGLLDQRACDRDALLLSAQSLIDFSNIFVMMVAMSYSIHYYSVSVQNVLLGLPATLQARYIGLTDRMRVVGANLGEPHTKAMGDGLFELRLMGAEGIARVMYCTLSGRRIVMLHGFIKKTQKTPRAELEIAIRRMKEVKHADAR